MARVDHYHDPHAPPANSIVPAVSAIVTNDRGEILMIHRTDNDLWSLPGGGMEIGETITEAVVREVKEETGIDVEVTGLVGVYSDPRHVVEYDDGEIRQQFSMCFACKTLGGQLAVSEESSEVAFFDPRGLDRLDMHESIRIRLRHYLAHSPQPVIA